MCILMHLTHGKMSTAYRTWFLVEFRPKLWWGTACICLVAKQIYWSTGEESSGCMIIVNQTFNCWITVSDLPCRNVIFNLQRVFFNCKLLNKSKHGINFIIYIEWGNSDSLIHIGYQCKPFLWNEWCSLQVLSAAIKLSVKWSFC